MNAIILVKGLTTRTMISLENKHYFTVTKICIETPVVNEGKPGTPEIEMYFIAVLFARNVAFIHENTSNSIKRVNIKYKDNINTIYNVKEVLKF